MTITGRWPIKGYGDLSYVVGYVKNDEKTKEKENENETAAKERAESSSFAKLFHYVQKNKKVENKEENKTYVSYQNINHPEQADLEMIERLKHYGVGEEDRCCYHQIQAFHWSDTITPDEVHEVGLRTAREMYPDFQVVVTTHLDRGHLHNHFIICAVNDKGRKLQDDFYGPEGLQRLREVSDKISMEYGCYIIKDAPLIGYGNGKKPKYADQLEEESQTSILRRKIDSLKNMIASLDEMVEMLTHEGYTWNGRFGDSMGFKLPGKERTIRLTSLGEGYAAKDISRHIYLNQQEFITPEKLAEYSFTTENEISKTMIGNLNNIKQQIDYSQKTLAPQERVPRFAYRRYKAKLELDRLREDIQLLDKYNVWNFDDLEKAIQKKTKEIDNRMKEYERMKQAWEKEKEKLGLLKTFLGTYNEACTYYEMKQISKDYSEKSDRVLGFEEAKEKLRDIDLQQARKLYTEHFEQGVKLNNELASISYDRYELKRLNEMKKGSLERNEEFILSFKITKERIDKKKSTNLYYYIKIPYLNEYMYIPKSCVAWDQKTLGKVYLVDDQIQTLYNSQGKETRKLTSEQVKALYDQRKLSYAEAYKGGKDDPAVPTKTFVFTVNQKLIDAQAETESSIRVFLPGTRSSIDVPKSRVLWIEEGTTAQIVLDDGDKIQGYDSQREKIEFTTPQLKEFFEERNKKFRDLRESEVNFQV